MIRVTSLHLRSTQIVRIRLRILIPPPHTRQRKRLFHVLVSRVGQRRKTVVHHVLLSILVELASLGELIDVALMHSVEFEERPVAKLVVPVSVAIVHHVVVN